MSSRDFAEDPVFGDLARELGPRFMSSVGERRSTDDWLEVEFAARGLAPAERAAVAHLLRTRAAPARYPSSAPPTAPADAGPRGTISCPRSTLADLAPRNPGLAALLAAHDNAARRPGPVRIMGVVNVTPDSFSDDVRFTDAERAVEHGLRLVDEGASVLDIGGESTRPGAAPVDAETELARVIPVIEGLARRTRTPISVDTTKSIVAETALESGATIVNDVSAGSLDPRMLDVVARHGAGFVAMHMQGTPRDMQVDPAYGDVVAEIVEFLRARVRACLDAGIERSRIWIDPGIGFGKRLEHNLEILTRLRELRSLGLTLCLGVSRKSFIAAVEARAGTPRDRSDPAQRLGGTAAAVTIGVWNGAEILRVHDVSVMVQAARVAEALLLQNRREESC